MDYKELLEQSIREEDIREAAALIRQAWQLVKETV